MKNIQRTVKKLLRSVSILLVKILLISAVLFSVVLLLSETEKTFYKCAATRTEYNLSDSFYSDTSAEAKADYYQYNSKFASQAELSSIMYLQLSEFSFFTKLIFSKVGNIKIESKDYPSLALTLVLPSKDRVNFYEFLDEEYYYLKDERLNAFGTFSKTTKVLSLVFDKDMMMRAHCTRL